MSKCPSTEILIFYYRCTVFDGLLVFYREAQSVPCLFMLLYLILHTSLYQSLSFQMIKKRWKRVVLTLGLMLATAHLYLTLFAGETLSTCNKCLFISQEEIIALSYDNEFINLLMCCLRGYFINNTKYKINP